MFISIKKYIFHQFRIYHKTGRNIVLLIAIKIVSFWRNVPAFDSQIQIIRNKISVIVYL